MDEVISFIKENIEIINSIISIIALFLGGKAYANYNHIKKSFNDTKEFNDYSEDKSQKAGRDIINNNNCDYNALATMTSATFESSMKAAYTYFEERTDENMRKIMSETERLIKEHNLNVGAYTKIDWINIFFENAKKSSDEYMQSIWAKVLAVEMASPGRISYKTLDVLKNMASTDYRLFEQMCSIEIFGYIMQGEKAEKLLKWTDQLKLREFGLLNLDASKRWFSLPVGGYNSIILGNEEFVLMMINSTQEEKKVEFSGYSLSSVAKELLPLTEFNYNEAYIIEFAKQLKVKYSNDVEIHLHRLNWVKGIEYNYNPIDIIAY